MEDLLNIQLAARYLGVSIKTIRNWAQKQKLSGMKIGPRGDWRFTREDLKRMIVDRKEVNPR